MKFTNKIQNSCSKLLSNLFWAYLMLVGFHGCGLPIFSSAAAVAISAPTASSVKAVPYVRRSRDTGGLSPTSAPEATDGQEQFGMAPALSSLSNSGFFQYPSFKHKYTTRVARFHGEPAHPATRTFSIRSMTSFPKLNPLASLLSTKSSEARNPSIEDLLEDESQDPTFTPFISARALTNIPQFFQHLRDNLEALQLDEDEEEDDADTGKNGRLLGQLGDSMFLYGNDDHGRILNIPPPPEKPLRWMPATAGMTGRAHNRHFINDPAEQDVMYRNPGRNAYEFGLG